MGFIGFRCPGRADETHTFESRFCLNECANVHGRQCVPSSILVNIEAGARNDKHQGQYMSVTALLPDNCDRKFKFERTMDYFIEPTIAYYSLRGRLLHHILQNPDFESMVRDMRQYVMRLFDRGLAHREDINGRWIDMKWDQVEPILMDLAANMPLHTAIDDWETEVEYVLPLGKINGVEREIRATIDVLRRTMGKIIDYKSCSDKGLSVVKRGPKDNHAWQTNCYKVMVERGHPVGVNPSQYHPPSITSLELYYITMSQIVGTGTDMVEISDWRVSDPEFDKNQRGEIVDEFNDLVIKRGKTHAKADPIKDYQLVPKKKWKITSAVPNVEIMDPDIVEAFMRERATALFEAFDRGKDFVADMAAPDTREWLCDYCPLEIKAACDSHNAKVGVKRVEDKQPQFQIIPVEE